MSNNQERIERSLWNTNFSNFAKNTGSQGVPIQKLQKGAAVPEKWCTFDPMLLNQKCVWKVVVYLKYWKQTGEKCIQIFEHDWKLSV